MTRQIAAVTGLLLCLASCGPVSVYYRPDVSVSRLNTDLTNCEVQSLRDAPVATQIRQSPPYYVGGGRYCDRNGRCYRRGGYWIPGDVYTVDANRNLRGRVLQQCMARQGYDAVRLPLCSQSVSRAAPLSGNRKLPQLTPSSCVIRYKNGSYQIVNTG